MNSPSYCLQKMLWQYTYEIYINTLIAIIYFLSKHHLQGGDREQHSKTIALVISIHTTRKVVTKDPRGPLLPSYFNPHHPQGGDSNFAQKPLLIPIHLHQQSAPNSLYILHSSTSKSNPKKYLIKIPVRIPRGFHVRFRFALKDQRLFHINPLIHSNMFNPCLILIPQIIKSEAIHIFINQFR